jgi:hypothetical protein
MQRRRQLWDELLPVLEKAMTQEGDLCRCVETEETEVEAIALRGIIYI